MCFLCSYVWMKLNTCLGHIQPLYATSTSHLYQTITLQLTLNHVAPKALQTKNYQSLDLMLLQLMDLLTDQLQGPPLVVELDSRAIMILESSFLMTRVAKLLKLLGKLQRRCLRLWALRDSSRIWGKVWEEKRVQNLSKPLLMQFMKKVKL